VLVRMLFSRYVDLFMIVVATGDDMHL